MTVEEFQKKYCDESTCIHEIFYSIDRGCPKCGGKDFYPLKKRRAYVCNKCLYHLYPLKGTIFENSKTPLKKWFYAIYLFSVSKNGVSAAELQRHLGVTYKTAWRIGHKIRQLFIENKDKLNGIVEIDETYVGGKGYNQRFKPYKERKEVLFGMVERNGRVRISHVPNNGARTLINQINTNIEKGSSIMSDEYFGYKKLSELGYDHKAIMHKKKYVDGDVYTNTIEGFWARLKKSLHGTYNCVSPKYLQDYANEFSFYRNHSDDPFSYLISKAEKPLQ